MLGFEAFWVELLHKQLVEQRAAYTSPTSRGKFRVLERTVRWVLSGMVRGMLVYTPPRTMTRRGSPGDAPRPSCVGNRSSLCSAKASGGSGDALHRRLACSGLGFRAVWGLNP